MWGVLHSDTFSWRCVFYNTRKFQVVRVNAKPASCFRYKKTSVLRHLTLFGFCHMTQA